jgi:N-acyl-D-amino-acid deacylase
MTGFPARKFGLTDRGEIRPGAFADLVLFDPETIIDRGTFEDPNQYPDGIAHVFVNGAHVVRNGEHTGARPGRALRR